MCRGSHPKGPSSLRLGERELLPSPFGKPPPLFFGTTALRLWVPAPYGQGEPGAPREEPGKEHPGALACVEIPGFSLRASEQSCSRADEGIQSDERS